MKATALCNRCDRPVEFDPNTVTQGYFAWCPYHDEDLFKFECYLEVTA